MFPQLPGSCYSYILELINENSYPGFSNLLSNLLTNEINTMSRRTININREKIYTNEEKLEKKERIFDQLTDFLNDEVKFHLKDTKNTENIECKYSCMNSY